MKTQQPKNNTLCKILIYSETQSKSASSATKKGYYRGFVPDTIRAFMDAEMGYYNEAILQTPIGTAAFQAAGNMKTRKLVKTHQNVLVFKKL